MRNDKKNLSGTKIIAGEMNFNLVLKKFKQAVDNSGKLEELKSRMFYEKPTTQRKRKKGMARSRWLKKLRDQALPKKMY